ncbi:MAG: CAP domain-containing protein [Legionella sp.]|nr:CAP domain-containing protein [Legionella sp.]
MYLLKRLCVVFLSVLWMTHSSYAKTTLTSAKSDQAVETAVLKHINEYRIHHGLSLLKMDNYLVREARAHSQDMAKHRVPFGHTGFMTRMKQAHLKIKDSGAGAENVAFNYKDAQTVVQQWLTSPGHKRNIDGHFNLTGIGIARDTKGRIYYTQIFLRTDKHPVKTYPRHHSHLFGISFGRHS